MAAADDREGGTCMDEQTTEGTAPTEATEEQATELLVEEVSIDGLCGVY